MFIIFEGLDGSGHSTQAHLLYGVLKERDIPALLTIEPTKESPVSKEIYDALFHKSMVEPRKLQELFVADRAWHVHEVIAPALAKGIVVISDRYLFSTVAFGSLNAPTEWLIEINKNFPLPDFTFVIDTKPETCMKRIGKRGGTPELFEKQEILRKVMLTYHELPTHYPNIYFIDGEQTIETVHQEILNHLTIIN